MATWQVQQAKTRLSELIADAQTKGPQIITKHGSKTAVVLSIGEYEALTTPEPRKSKMSLVDFLLTAPKFETDEEYQEFLADCRRYPDDLNEQQDNSFFSEDYEGWGTPEFDEHSVKD